MHRLELRSSLIGAAAILAFPAEASGETCRINGVDAVRSAREAGFTFRVERSSATRCELTQSTIVVAAPQARDVVCWFHVFGGRVPESGWSLLTFSFSAPEGTEVDTSRLPRGWLLRINAPRAQTSRVNLRSVSIRGEDCLKWRDAFAGE